MRDKATKEDTNQKKNSKKMIAKKGLKDTKDERFRLEDEIVIGLNLVDDKNIKVMDKRKKQKQNKKIAKKQKAMEQKRGKEEPKRRVQSRTRVSKAQNQVAPVQRQARTTQTGKPQRTNNVKKQPTKPQKPVRKLTPRQYMELEEKRRKVKKILLNIIKLLVLLLICIGIFLFATLSPMFDIAEVIVEKNETIPTNTIISLSRLELGENIFRFSKSEVEQNIKENPYVEKAIITRVIPNQVKIQIVERKPRFQLEYGGSYVYMNSQGYFLELSGQKQELPILIGWKTKGEEIVAGNRFCQEDLVRLGDVLKIVKAAETYQIYDKITKIDMEDHNNYKLILEGEQKTVHLGTATKLDTKMPNIQMLLEKESGVAGEYFLNVDLNKRDPYFREKV